MERRTLLASFLVAFSLMTGTVPAAEPPAADGTVTAVAQRWWIISETILGHHIAPPTRQEMFLRGLRGLLKVTGSQVSPELAPRLMTEMGNNCDRFRDPQSLQCHAGTPPITQIVDGQAEPF